MPRSATPLNIEAQPGIGMGYVIKHRSSRKLIRCSTTCQRDIEREGSKIKQLRAFSGDHPFFTVKIGSLHTEIQVLKFLCGKADGKKCLDSKGEYEWLGVSLKDARKAEMKFEEPNYVASDTPAAPVKVKSKPTKAKVVKSKPVAKAVKARKVRAAKTVTAPAIIDGNVTAIETVASQVEPVASVQEETPTAPAKVVQTDAEFEAEIAAEFEADAAKASLAVAQ